MSWIKDNQFLVALASATLVGAGVLLFIGAKWQSAYNASKEEFQTASSEVDSYAKMPLYPKQEHVDGKIKALDEYTKSLDTLQKAFDSYRPAEIKDSSPQDFTNRVKAADAEVRQAFKDSDTKVPDLFFCGFEPYQGKFALGKATGILSYELDGIKALMLALAKSKATELNNLHRQPLPEETGAEYKPQPDDVARPLSLEISFTAAEQSAREFLSSIAKLEGRYVVIRTLRISNTKQDPPRTSDAKFDSNFSLTAPSANNDPFATPPADDANSKTAASAPADSSRILAQVLGDEQVRVFLRLDLLCFLPSKKLP